jgi:hypothetical protein
VAKFGGGRRASTGFDARIILLNSVQHIFNKENLRRSNMATITINDLCKNDALDMKAMSSIMGAGGAPWVYGWARPYIDKAQSFGSGGPVNLFQTNNFYIADQMNNLFSVVDVKNTAANSTINVNALQQAGNSLQLA